MAHTIDTEVEWYLQWGEPSGRGVDGGAGARGAHDWGWRQWFVVDLALLTTPLVSISIVLVQGVWVDSGYSVHSVVRAWLCPTPS